MGDTFSQVTLWRLFLMGGPLMWPMLLCSFFALMIVMERFAFFRRIDVDVTGLQKRIVEAVRGNDIKAALECCDSLSTPLTRMMKTGLLKWGQPRTEIVAAMEEVGHLEVPELEKGLNILLAIGQVTPLLGLLGTVIGIAASFQSIQSRAAAMSPVALADIAGGIWAALVAMIAGLTLAIPVLLFYSYFVARARQYALNWEKSLANFADLLTRAYIPPEQES